MHHHWGQLQHEPMDSKYYWVPSKWKYFVCIWVYEYMHMCKGNRASECVAAWIGLADSKAHRVQWHILPLISVHRHLLRTQRKPLYFFLLRKGDPKPTFALSGTGWIMLLGPCRDPCKPYLKLELPQGCTTVCTTFWASLQVREVRVGDDLCPRTAFSSFSSWIPEPGPTGWHGGDELMVGLCYLSGLFQP